jgi:hypothetical protein
MRKINPKIIIAIILFLIISIVLFVVFKNKKTPNQTVERFQQNLNIPNYFQGSVLPIENNVKKSDFNFPSTLPYLKQTGSTSLDTSTINKIAANFGFIGEPQVFNDIQNGKVLIWNGDVYSLTIIPRKNSVQFVSNSGIRNLILNSGDKKLNDEDIKSIANDLLTSKIGIDSNNIKFAGFSYYKIQNGIENLAKTNKDGAQIIQLNYSEGNFKYPILTTDPDKAQITIQLLKNGEVSNLTANLGFNFQNSPSEYPLKSYEQFSKEIGSSILISLNDNNVNLPDIKNSDIKKITIDKISLAYLLDLSTQKISQPVFLLEGTALVNNFNGPINVSLYLPAFESSI